MRHRALSRAFAHSSSLRFNVCIKVIIILLGYINFLPLPWRVAIGVDAVFPPKAAPRASDDPPGVGLDFYGRPTEALWFHMYA